MKVEIKTKKIRPHEAVTTHVPHQTQGEQVAVPSGVRHDQKAEVSSQQCAETIGSPGALGASIGSESLPEPQQQPPRSSPGAKPVVAEFEAAIIMEGDTTCVPDIPGVDEVIPPEGEQEVAELPSATSHQLSALQRVELEEACSAKERAGVEADALSWFKDWRRGVDTRVENGLLIRSLSEQAAFGGLGCPNRVAILLHDVRREAVERLDTGSRTSSWWQRQRLTVAACVSPGQSPSSGHDLEGPEPTYRHAGLLQEDVTGNAKARSAANQAIRNAWVACVADRYDWESEQLPSDMARVPPPRRHVMSSVPTMLSVE